VYFFIKKNKGMSIQKRKITRHYFEEINICVDVLKYGRRRDNGWKSLVVICGKTRKGNLFFVGGGDGLLRKERMKR
jgi:hypothetical protein